MTDRKQNCTYWIFGKDGYGYHTEHQCGKPATDTCDYCGDGRCDEHMQIKRGEGLGGRSMCSTTRHS